MTAETESTRIRSVGEYFRRIDKGDFAAELFTPDFEFFFPKYGVGRGAAALAELAGGLMQAVTHITHHLDAMLLIEAGRYVVAEGTTEGSDRAGRSWRGGETPGGRFCSVFAFRSDGLIERMHIYTDPDYTGQDSPRFHWSPDPGRRW